VTEHLDLPDGQWAELRTAPTHGQYVAIMAAQERAMLGRSSFEEAGDIRGRTLTVTWNVRGEDGKPLDLDDWDEMPAAIGILICQKAQELWEGWQAARRPKATRSKTNGSADPQRRRRTSARSSASTSAVAPST
jgi:hypothetical protein